jgi:L-ascorbate metabolism protein UlaG (beta-lactamase superfamily)
MAFVGHVNLGVERANEPPFREILRRWMEAAYEPAACRAALESIIVERDVAPGLFEPSAIDRGGLVATEALIYGRLTGPERFRCSFYAPGGQVLSLACAAEKVGALADLVRVVASAGNIDDMRDVIDGLEDGELDMLASCYRDRNDHGYWPDHQKPGIHRREHASLFIRTAEAALITDPQHLSLDWTTAQGCYPMEGSAPLQARVLLTHTHGDHYHLASMIARTAADLAAIVPRVPRASILAEDVAAHLRAAGQAVITPAWFDRITEGDVTIDVLPFYGEQPTRSLPPSFVDARNWGNCYRFNFRDHSVAILVDSGVDSAGSMLEVLERSVKEHGPIEILMSCCAEFPEAINPGLDSYQMMVPFDDLRRLFHTRRESVTLGPRGLAEACQVCQARYFMPYAHGFSGLGKSPVTVEGKHAETESLRHIQSNLEARRVKTQILTWNPGDVMRWDDGRVVVEPVGRGPS